MSPEVEEKFQAYLAALRESDEVFHEYLVKIGSGDKVLVEIENRRAIAQAKLRNARQSLDEVARKP